MQLVQQAPASKPGFFISTPLHYSHTPSTGMPGPVRAIDRLRKAANLEPTKKVVELSDGSKFEMWVAPLTMAERERAQKQAKSDDANAFALQLLIAKALDESGAKLFNVGEVDVLKNEVKDKDLQALMLAILTDDAEPIDPKS